MRILLTGAVKKRKANSGSFKRMRHTPWTPETWNDGYVDNRGRFRVYRPDYPRAYALGYALRAHVVWWLHHGEPHPVGTNLHHKDEIKTNDMLSNLECIEHGEHSRRHHEVERVTCLCNQCSAEIFETPNRVYKNGRGKFCSQRCMHAFKTAHGSASLSTVEARVA